MDPKRNCRLAPAACNPLTPDHPVINAFFSIRVSQSIPSPMPHARCFIIHIVSVLVLPSLHDILEKALKGYSTLLVQLTYRSYVNFAPLEPNLVGNLTLSPTLTTLFFNWNGCGSLMWPMPGLLEL